MSIRVHPRRTCADMDRHAGWLADQCRSLGYRFVTACTSGCGVMSGASENFPRQSATFGSAKGFIGVKLLSAMNRKSQPSDDSWESDAVWKLLDQASCLTAGARFVDDTVRAARLRPPEKSWWTKWCTPAPLAGLAATTAGAAFAIFLLPGPDTPSPVAISLVNSPRAEAIQEIAETETLIAATDQLDDFSDNELVSLIGF